MENKIAVTIRSTAIILMILGLIAGFITGINLGGYNDLYEKQFSWIWAFVTWLSSFIACLLIYGLSEIIQLLETIEHNTRN